MVTAIGYTAYVIENATSQNRGLKAWRGRGRTNRLGRGTVNILVIVMVTEIRTEIGTTFTHLDDLILPHEHPLNDSLTLLLCLPEARQIGLLPLLLLDLVQLTSHSRIRTQAPVDVTSALLNIMLHLPLPSQLSIAKNTSLRIALHPLQRHR